MLPVDAYHESMQALVRVALQEDIREGDITSLAALEPNPARGGIIAKSDGVLSGVEPVMLVFRTVDSANKVRFLLNDGDRFCPGQTVAEIDGFNQTILASERVALNFLGCLSGVATMTRAFVERISGTSCTILDTRKTTPGWRLLEKAAVCHGGGKNHRLGLYDMILIKDNHIASAGSVAGAVRRAREFLDTAGFRLQFNSSAERVDLEVEVATEEQLKEALGAGVKRIMIDNQAIESLARLVKTARKLDPDAKLEASGNVTLETVAQIAATGVDYISVGAITHSAPAADFSLQFSEE
ncbi:MAG TPA: carboxylating nicotinate-nucleotide diphosphorylase [Acidobacteriota bacterium]|nr:carboxylating nicotinate-nucleotide diphosphorylase [Acidobacteriota bacterium]